MFRYVDEGNFYFFLLNGNIVRVLKMVDDEMLPVSAWHECPTCNQGYTQNVIKIDLAGNSFSCSVNDMPIFEAHDDDSPEGDIGLIVISSTEGSAHVGFDRVMVKALPEPVVIGSGWEGIPENEKISFSVSHPPKLQIKAYWDTDENYLRFVCSADDASCRAGLEWRREFHLFWQRSVRTMELLHEYLRVFITAGNTLVNYHPWNFYFVQDSEKYFVGRDDFIREGTTDSSQLFTQGGELWPGETITGYLAIPDEVDTSKGFELWYEDGHAAFPDF